MPDFIRVFSDDDQHGFAHGSETTWTDGIGNTVSLLPVSEGRSVVRLSAPKSSVKRIHMRWHGDLKSWRSVMGDAWERGYGDLSWQELIWERHLPWYFAAFDGVTTHGYGVQTGPAAFCFWQADPGGISLWCDVRSGGLGIQLGSRTLDVCTIVTRQGTAGETSFQALRGLCHDMCPKPRLPREPIYGHNDWNFYYGHNSAASTLEVTKRIVALAPDGGNRPFVVIDDGWEPAGAGRAGPWDKGNDKFPDMPGLAAQVKAAGAKPGIWIRPTTAWNDLPENWRLAKRHGSLDPTVPEVKHQIAGDIARLKDWGYGLVKHDFSTVDILGRFGNSMGAQITDDGWGFAEGRMRTTAEIILELYQIMRQAAGDMVILGCNTFGHLSAGIFEACRVGDDTSGNSWDRTRKMGVNSLAFRGAQNGAFYATDPDIAALTKNLPWEKSGQWLDLVSRSGAVLFVALDPAAVGPEQERALKAAFARAAKPQPIGEPRDWMASASPERWVLDGQEATFDWQVPEGASPFGV